MYMLFVCTRVHVHSAPAGTPWGFEFCLLVLHVPCLVLRPRFFFLVRLCLGQQINVIAWPATAWCTSV